jgi:hypothetical protein
MEEAIFSGAENAKKVALSESMTVFHGVFSIIVLVVFRVIETTQASLKASHGTVKG